MDDVVNNPKHYKLPAGGGEFIDILRRILTPEEFRGLCKGSAYQYIFRAEGKNGAQDYEKAAFYLRELHKEAK